MNDPLQAFLAANPWIRPITAEAMLEAPKYFERCSMRLELIVDPESAEMQVALVIGVRCPAEEAMARLDAFDEAWGLEHLNGAQDVFFVTVEFLEEA